MTDIQHHNLLHLLTRDGPFKIDGMFEPSLENLSRITENSRVLVVGAGGLGCEILKNLALSGFRDVHVIDLDTIDISNLNRQFLFRKAHVGKHKAEVAAAVIMAKFPDVQVKHYTRKIQEFPQSWYRQFDVVIAGLDNVDARVWLNRTLNDLVDYDEDGDLVFETVIPLIDGGTEGLRGQARLFYPKATSCFECSLDSMPQGNVFHSCTIASTPRIPEHCIAYAHEVMWPKLTRFAGPADYEMAEEEQKPPVVPLDKDDPHHMSWIYQRAAERAAEFKIEGVTYKLTMQVVKNIIPAVASTNAIVSAACVGEAVKALTFCSEQLTNFMAYNGVSMAGCNVFKYAKKDGCPACSQPLLHNISLATTVAELRALIEAGGISDASLSAESGAIYLGGTLAKMYENNLERPVSDFVPPQSTRVIHASTADKVSATVKVVYTDA